ncbi:MAG: ATP-binding cassette, subfamily bacterial, partial [Thermotogaceae bacterium]|nr:ATP-binding cassette, subfamily bacterial [Thermotogaceae bacterium]
MLKRFISYYRPHIKLFILDISCAFMMAGIDLIFPQLTQRTLDQYIPNGEMQTLLIMILIMAALYTLRMVFNYIVDYWGHVVGTRMEYDMRKEIFSHLQSLSFSYFDKVRTGKIMSRIISDLRDITELAHHGPEDVFISIVTLIGAFILLIMTNVYLTLIVFSFVPIMLFYGIKKRKKMAVAFRTVRKKIANVNADLENSISGIRVAKSFTNEDFEMEKFDLGNNEFRESREFAFKAMAEMTSGITYLNNLLKVILLGVGGYFAFRGWLSVGALVAFFMYIELFFQPVRRLMMFTQQYESGMAGFERFVEVLNIHPEIQEKEDAIELENVKGEVDIDNVSFSYDQKEYVLKGCSLKIPEGKTIALVGPSGGGKTTLCHLIPRFYEINDGSIKIDGIDIRDVTLESLRKNIGIVQQDVFLFAGTIRDNIAYGRGNATDDEIIEAAKHANIHDFIMTLDEGYETYIGERGVRLSGGQKQRISIARVFLKNPPLLILDEATSSLDNETELKIQQSLEKLSKGRTSLVIAHRLSTIKNADEILVISGEGIMERGKHEELIQKDGYYSKLY